MKLEPDKLHFARIHGLTVASEFPLPGWTAAVDDNRADIEVRRGAVEVSVAGALETVDHHLVTENSIVICHPEGPRCRAESGRVLTVDVSDGGEHLTHFIIQGVGMSALLFQRGLYPIHCSCTAWDNRALMICGHSGRGKSTLTALLVRSGLSFLTDDRIVPAIAGDRGVALPGLPCLNLGDESASMTGFAQENRQRFPAGRGKWHYFVPEFHVDRPVEIGMIVIMDWSEDLAGKRLEKLDGLEALSALRAQINYEDLLRKTRMEPGFMEIAGALLHRVPVFRYRPRRAIELARQNAEELKALFLEGAF